MEINILGNIKFKWLEDYDTYKSIMNIIGNSPIPSFITENMVDDFEFDGISAFITLKECYYSISITVLESYINPYLRKNNWNVVGISMDENNRLRMHLMFGNYSNYNNDNNE